MLYRKDKKKKIEGVIPYGVRALPYGVWNYTVWIDRIHDHCYRITRGQITDDRDNVRCTVFFYTVKWAFLYRIPGNTVYIGLR